MEKVIKNRYRIIFIFLLLVIGWNIMTIADDDEPGYLDYIQLYSQIFETIQTRYLEETDPVILAEGAIDGILLTNSHYASLEPVNGKSGLIPAMGPASTGLVLGYKEPMIRVIDVIPGSPADIAGIIPGDNIIRINDKVTPFLTIDRARRMLTGNQEESVELLIQNHLSFMLDETELTFQPPEHDVSGVDSHLDSGVMILSVRGRLDDNLIQNVKKSIAETPELSGAILDLRHLNRGKEITGIQLADIFIADGRAISALCDSEDKITETIKSGDNLNYAGFPMVVILDETSAGPAETCALALKIADRATITGDRSFGKAIRTSPVPLDKDFVMNLVVGEYCSPDGTSLESGVNPDFPVELPIMGDEDPCLLTARSILQNRQGPEIKG